MGLVGQLFCLGEILWRFKSAVSQWRLSSETCATGNRIIISYIKFMVVHCELEGRVKGVNRAQKQILQSWHTTYRTLYTATSTGARPANYSDLGTFQIEMFYLNSSFIAFSIYIALARDVEICCMAFMTIINNSQSDL